MGFRLGTPSSETPNLSMAAAPSAPARWRHHTLAGYKLSDLARVEGGRKKGPPPAGSPFPQDSPSLSRRGYKPHKESAEQRRPQLDLLQCSPWDFHAFHLLLICFTSYRCEWLGAQTWSATRKTSVFCGETEDGWWKLGMSGRKLDWRGPLEVGRRPGSPVASN